MAHGGISMLTELQMNICRQCFREKATDIGFNKVGFFLLSVYCVALGAFPRNTAHSTFQGKHRSFSTETNTSTTVPLNYSLISLSLFTNSFRHVLGAPVFKPTLWEEPGRKRKNEKPRREGKKISVAGRGNKKGKFRFRGKFVYRCGQFLLF